MTQVRQSKQSDKFASFPKQYTYQEVISYLHDNWSSPIVSLEPFKEIILDINKSLLSIPSIILTGTSGKTITSYFLSSLLKKENLSVGAFSYPCFIQHNEQITINSKQISNTDFATYATTLLNKSNEQKHNLHSHELLLGIFLLHSLNQKVDLITLERKNLTGIDLVQLFTPRIIGVTKFSTSSENIPKTTKLILTNASPTTFVVAAEQNKKNIQELNIETNMKKAQWIMPIRKIAPLPYPYEQLHGKYATLAERIATTYLVNFASKENKSSLLNKPKQHRGRPTLKLQKEKQLRPTETITHFWEHFKVSIPGKFQIIETKKCPVVLDSARSIDAFEQLLLGLRLLSYKSTLQNIYIIAGSLENAFDHETFIKQIRYFFKRNNGKIFFCPVPPQKQNNDTAWNPEKICNIAKNVKIKSEAYSSFSQAFEEAQEESDESSLIIITGSTEIITEYWNHKHV